MKILTVAIPSYNVEKTLRAALESLCAEEIIELLDIIVVNDGSEDLTVSVAEEFAVKYPESVSIVSKKNGGHGSAVNCGIDCAKGLYFKVLDGDDRVDTEGFIRLVKRLAVTSSDLVLCNYKKVPLDGGAEMPMVFDDIEYGRTYGFDEIPVNGRTYFGIHSITVKTSILKDNGIRLQEKTFYVDAEYGLLPVPFINTVEFIDAFVYLYYIGGTGQSINIQNFIKRYDDHLRVVKRLTEYYTGAECAKSKKNYMFSVLNKLCYTQYMLAFFYDNNKTRAKHRAADFDGWLRNSSGRLYKSLGGSFYIRVMRLLRFKLLPGALFRRFLKFCYDMLKPVLKKRRKYTY